MRNERFHPDVDYSDKLKIVRAIKTFATIFVIDSVPFG